MTAQQMHGPASWEGPARHYGPVERVAVVSDVHANLPALAAVLADLRSGPPVDLIVSCGDLTWGAQPDETLSLLREFGERLVCIRGNSERAVAEIRAGTRPAARPREAWVPAQHGAASAEFAATVPFSAVVDVVGLGPVRFCHGSPRSDTELVTGATPPERVAELASGIEERVLVTGHTHLQFDRRVAGLRSVNPGSVGLPFHEGEPGTAYWVLLGPDVELRSTRYDVGPAAEAGMRLGDPGAEQISQLLLSPPSPAQIMDEAERLLFSD